MKKSKLHSRREARYTTIPHYTHINPCYQRQKVVLRVTDRNKECSSLTAIFLSSKAPYFTPLTTSLFFFLLLIKCKPQNTKAVFWLLERHLTRESGSKETTQNQLSVSWRYCSCHKCNHFNPV